MPDYNLGRATGEISIGYDGRGVREAQGDMAAMAAEAAALDAAMERVNRTFDENRRSTKATAEDIVRARAEVDRLGKAYKELQNEYDIARRKVADAYQHTQDLAEDEIQNYEKLREARIALNLASDDALKAQQRAVDAYEQHQAKIVGLNRLLDEFNGKHSKASEGFRTMAREAQKFGEVLEGLNEKMSAVARILGGAGLFGLFGGAAAGTLFANAAGGVHLLAGAMSAIVEVAQSFAGAMALIPAGVNAAVLSFGTLAVALHGVGGALGSLEDPAKFTQAIRDMSPAAQQAMLQIQQFTYAFRGARNEIQNSLFAPIIADIQPLIQTWLPSLMNAGKEIANQFGQSFHQVFQVFQSPEAKSGFQVFLGNMISGFQAARGAIAPFLTAWNKLAEVGSGVFPRLGEAITKIATEFNNWIQRTAASGQLLDFINKALDGFTNMGRIIRDFALGISNVFGLFNTQGQTTLGIIAGIAEKFRTWSESVQGQGEILNFFTLIRAAAQAVKPQLDLLAQGMAVVGRTLTVLGIAIQPGINSFFTSFLEALKGLAPYVIQIAPAINGFLTQFGQVLLQVVNSLGPQLPGFFADMSAAFVSLMQVIPPVVGAFADLMSHVTPHEIELFLGLTVALKGVLATLPLIRGAMVALNFVMAANPIGLVVVAVGALAAAAAVLIANWDRVGPVFSSVWESIKNGVADIWNGAFEWGRKIIDNLTQGIADAARTGLTTVIDWVASLFPDSWKTRSPSKRGPLSEMGPEEMGARLVTQYAAGIAGGRSSVQSAVDGVAGDASAIGGSGGAGGGAGFGSTGFSSAGVSGTSGRDFSQGHSGFDQWVSFITQDLTAWSNIFQEAFGMVNSIASIVMDTTRVVANLWNGGNNPLTQPGGLMGAPLPIAQQAVPGVPQIPIPGVAPDEYGRKLAGASGGAPQQSVPGVPNRPLPGHNGNAGTPPANPPASTTGAAAPSGGQDTIPLTQRPDGTWTSTNPEWAKLIQRESSGNPTNQNNTDSNAQKGIPSQGLFQITQPTWESNGGLAFAPTPKDASPQDQAKVAANIFNARGGQPWGSGANDNRGRENEDALRAGIQRGGAPAPAGGGAAPPPAPAGPEQLPPGVRATSRPGIYYSQSTKSFVDRTGNYVNPATGKSYSLPNQGAGPPQPGMPGAAGRPVQQRDVDLKDQATPTGGLPQFPITDSPTAAHGGAINPDKFLVHTEEGDSPTAQALADSMAGRTTNRASYNYLVDPNTGAVVRAVQPGTEAWSVGSPGNQTSINAVIAGSKASWSREEWLQHDNALNSLAMLAAQNAAQFNIPISQLGPGSESGIGGHDWVARNLGGTDHTDPGPDFPWDNFLGRVRQYAGAAGAPVTAQDAKNAASAAPAEGGANARVAPQTQYGQTGDRLGAMGLPAPVHESGGSAVWRNFLDMGAALGQEAPEQFNAGPRANQGVDQGFTVPVDPNNVNLGFQWLGANPINAPDRRGRRPGSAGGLPVMGQGPAWQVNPASRAKIPLGGTTTQAVQRAGLKRLYNGAEVPPEIAQFAGDFGLKVNTRTDGGSLHEAGFAFDITGSPEDMDRFSQFIYDNMGAQTLELIHSNEKTGQKWGIAGGQSVDRPGDKYQNYFTDQYGAHGDYGDGAHVHWATDVLPMPGGTPVGGPPRRTTNTAAANQPQDSSWMNVPAGWDITQPIPQDVRRQHNIADDMPPMFYNAQPGTVQNIPVPADYSGPDIVNHGTISEPTTTGAPIAGFPSTNDQRTPLEKIQQGFQSAASIAGDGFKIFGDVIADIGAAANMTDTLVRGFANTEDIVGFIRQVQPFLQTGSDVAKLVGDVGGMAGSASGGMDMGIGSAIGAVAGIVSAAFDAVNQSISLGIDIYHEVGKYAGYLFGSFLGGDNTGPLGGNVRMLLNTRTNQLQTYSEDNPLNKNTFNVPTWQQSYTQQPNTQQQLPAQVNIYTGPNQSPRDMMNESMWLVSAGSGSVASVAGSD